MQALVVVNHAPKKPVRVLRPYRIKTSTFGGAHEHGELPPSFNRSYLKPVGWNKFVIHPENPLRNMFEITAMFCVLYTAVVEPLKVAYLIDIAPNMDLFLDAFFGFDIIFQCFCG